MAEHFSTFWNGNEINYILFSKIKKYSNTRVQYGIVSNQSPYFCTKSKLHTISFQQRLQLWHARKYSAKCTVIIVTSRPAAVTSTISTIISTISTVMVLIVAIVVTIITSSVIIIHVLWPTATAIKIALIHVTIYLLLLRRLIWSTFIETTPMS